MTYSAPHRAVIMARGLGTRMRKEAEGLHLDADQQAAAEAGVKAMISVGRPFLDHVLGELADAGYDEVCLVIGPEHQMIRDYYDHLDTRRITISYAVQEEPLGTANAVQAAADFAGQDRVLVINSDNHYPADAVRKLAEAPGAATLGFDRYAMVEGSNIAADRISAFALLQADPEGNLREIIEKPSPEMAASLGEDAMLSMNCWLLTPPIVAACATVEPSARGELEIVDAVRNAVDAGEPVQVIPVQASVLDLSHRNDISGVAERLAGKEPTL